MVDVQFLIGEHKPEVMDETLSLVIDEIDEVLHQQQNVELHHNLMVMVEIHYMVIDETEQMLLLEVGVETDMNVDAQGDADDIVYIELEVMVETEQMVDTELHQLQLELIEETDEIEDIEQQVLEQRLLDATLGILQVVDDETLGDECMVQESLYEVVELIIALMHTEVMVEMVEIHHQLIVQEVLGEMQQMVEQYIFYIDEHSLSDVLMFLLENDDVDDSVLIVAEQITDAIDILEKNSFLKYIFK